MTRSTPFKNIKVHVHTKDNTCFVRSWKLAKIGEELRSARERVAKVNRTQKAVNTLGVRKAGLSMRFVACVTEKDGTPLGSVRADQGEYISCKKLGEFTRGFLAFLGEAGFGGRVHYQIQKFCNFTKRL